MKTIDDIIKTTFVDDRHRLMANMVYTVNWLQGSFVEFLKPYGLSPQQFNILRILRGKGGWLSMNDIKAVMVERAPNATRLSDKLLEKGLVERKRSEEDRRVVYLNITKQGLELLKLIDEKQDPTFQLFMEAIGIEEARKFSDLLDRIRNTNQ